MNIGADVLRLIFLTEKIQADVHTLSPKEALLVGQCASQLLIAISAPVPTSAFHRKD
jgi:hypothetical protein